ncbi:hypothetical protein ACWD5R_28270 [Streptomyces sp. NPDC002514]|uniref:hypothetical protein n=1 Tax=Streptomyces sp. NPDC001270 TaxID=3364554 RepID=UPI0036A963C6
MNIGSYPSVSSTYLPSVRQELTAAYRGRTVNLSEGNALFWTRRRGESANVKAFLEVQGRAPLPRGVQAVTG